MEQNQATIKAKRRYPDGYAKTYPFSFNGGSADSAIERLISSIANSISFLERDSSFTPHTLDEIEILRWVIMGKITSLIIIGGDSMSDLSATLTEELDRAFSVAKSRIEK